MIRALLYALISIFAITFVRMVVGIIMKGFSDLMREETQAQSRPASPPPNPKVAGVPTAGEFKPCKQCGTYVVASSAIKASLNGETFFFCSQDCREKSGGS